MTSTKKKHHRQIAHDKNRSAVETEKGDKLKNENSIGELPKTAVWGANFYLEGGIAFYQKIMLETERF